MTALGGAYAAERNRGPVGDACRSVGKIATVAATTAQEEKLLRKFATCVRYFVARSSRAAAGDRSEDTPSPCEEKIGVQVY